MGKMARGRGLGYSIESDARAIISRIFSINGRAFQTASSTRQKRETGLRKVKTRSLTIDRSHSQYSKAVDRHAA
jgi:hypothetical protein